jgi:predicted lipoprotein with Yx(FWY)xxD motif
MKISRSLLSSLNFRPFTQNDYYGFAGVSSPVPLIAETDKICVIIDGDTAELYTFDTDGSFDCADICENIRDLPSQTEVEKKIAQLKRELAELEG